MTRHGSATNASDISKNTGWETVELVECMSRDGRPPLRPRPGRQKKDKRHSKEETHNEPPATAVLEAKGAQ